MIDNELKARVLAHVTRYPGLTAYEIARALRLAYKGGGPAVRRTQDVLIKLLLDGKVTAEMVPMDITRTKRIWRPA